MKKYGISFLLQTMFLIMNIQSSGKQSDELTIFKEDEIKHCESRLLYNFIQDRQNTINVLCDGTKKEIQNFDQELERDVSSNAGARRIARIIVGCPVCLVSCIISCAGSCLGILLCPETTKNCYLKT